MLDDLTQVHLNAARCSRRAVRFQPLSPEDLDQLVLDAAKLIDETGTMIQLRKAEWRLGVKRMLKAVSKNPVTDPNDPKIEWITLSEQVLDVDYGKYFNAKDHAVLVALYRDWHEINDADLSAIAGKASRVAT